IRGGCVELAADFVTQTPRDFGGEGDHQDARGISSALANQVSDTSGQSGGLPAASTGDDAEWSVASGDHSLLGRREAIVHPARPTGLIEATAAGALCRTVVASCASGSWPRKRGFLSFSFKEGLNGAPGSSRFR